MSDEVLTFYLIATTLRLITTPLTGSHSDLWRHLIKRSQHYEIKATPKWLIELKLIGLKNFYFILSGGNRCFPVVLMSSNIYLCPALIVLCLFIALFSHGNAGASEVRCRVKALPRAVTTQEAPHYALRDGVYSGYTATKACRGGARCEKGGGGKARRGQNSPPVSEKEQATSDVLKSGSKTRVFLF